MITFIPLFLLMFGSVFGVTTQDALPTTYDTIGYAQGKLGTRGEQEGTRGTHPMGYMPVLMWGTRCGDTRSS